MRAADAAGEIPDNSPFVVRSWQVEDGLPHNSVNQILQTQDGYLWLATDDGLARFDGVHVFADDKNPGSVKRFSNMGSFTGMYPTGCKVCCCFGRAVKIPQLQSRQKIEASFQQVICYSFS